MAPSAAKATLYALVDALPEREVRAAERYLTFLASFAEADDDDEMDDEESARFDAALDASMAQAERGEMRPASAVLEELRARHRRV